MRKELIDKRVSKSILLLNTLYLVVVVICVLVTPLHLFVVPIVSLYLSCLCVFLLTCIYLWLLHKSMANLKRLHIALVIRRSLFLMLPIVPYIKCFRNSFAVVNDLQIGLLIHRYNMHDSIRSYLDEGDILGAIEKFLEYVEFEEKEIRVSQLSGILYGYKEYLTSEETNILKRNKLLEWTNILNNLLHITDDQDFVRIVELKLEALRSIIEE